MNRQFWIALVTPIAACLACSAWLTAWPLLKESGLPAGPVLFESERQILQYHGITVYALDQITDVLEAASITGVSFAAAGRGLFGESAWDRHYLKPTPGFQDAEALLLFSLAAAIVYVSWLRPDEVPGWAKGLAVYLLADMALFYVRVLWFDDLTVGRTAEQLQVWSQRRIFFQAIGNFVESLALFTVFYRCHLPVRERRRGFLHALSVSYSTAVCLGRDERVPESGRHIVNCQLMLSMFFLVIVISVVGSQVYGRQEIAPNSSMEAMKSMMTPRPVGKPAAGNGNR